MALTMRGLDVQVPGSSGMCTVLWVGPEAQGTGWGLDQTTSWFPKASDAHPARLSLAVPEGRVGTMVRARNCWNDPRSLVGTEF